VVAATVIAPAAAADISGAGATFPYPIYAKWAEVYRKETGIAVKISRSAPVMASGKFGARW
jgi:phosphate transport system substrate-binding protein